MGIIIKSAKEIDIMRQAGKIVAIVLEKLREEAKPGITTKDLNRIAEEEAKKNSAIPSFKGYRGFPASICASVNEEIVHGIPDKRALSDGDIISIDFGAIYNGYQGDAAITIPIGKISKKAQKLLDTTSAALQKGIAKAKDGVHIGDVSAAIQYHVESNGFSVVREYVGHGIGQDMHEYPQIPNFGVPGRGPILRKGMALAIEPMVNVGTWKTRLTDSGWTVVTQDGSLSAHFEHTIVITDGVAEILTAV
ncbi:MAG: type I methionyl aminopeptidase [Chloroflexi bacterium]|jgi:methionyl aminopeptidase|nr:type I methionyl aminopeptidase [Chloroflexota bacterium]MBT7080862.1 type I methionyl aminopeptidase [Chloroflexota bacterium]MBT7289386.1 type I methionyl aminopeptidase [Chloroflexota bacterium]